MLVERRITKDYSYSLLNAVTTMAVCDCVKQAQLEKRLEFAKIPEEFKDITIKSFDLNYYSKTKSTEGLSYYQHAAKAKRVAANFVKYYLDMKEHNKGLYIYFKEPGTGKTRLAIAVLNALMVMYKVSGAYVVVKDLMDEIKETFNKDSDSEYTKGEIIEAVQKVDVLMLDDIGVEHSSDFSKQELYSIINKRYIEKKLTIFTSNCSLDQLPHGHRLISRIKGMTYSVFLPGDDIRQLISRKVEDETLKNLLES